MIRIRRISLRDIGQLVIMTISLRSWIPIWTIHPELKDIDKVTDDILVQAAVDHLEMHNWPNRMHKFEAHLK